MQEFELTKTEIWRPKNDITANIKNKLLPMEVKRTSPQAYVVLSKSELEILVPWAKVVQVPKKVRKNKGKNKDKDRDHQNSMNEYNNSLPTSESEKIRKKHRTKTIKNNGMNPEWSEELDNTFRFKCVKDTTFLVLKVKQCSSQYRIHMLIIDWRAALVGSKRARSLANIMQATKRRIM